MTATGPNNVDANYQSREFLDEIFGSQHDEFYKVKSFYFVPLSFFIGVFSLHFSRLGFWLIHFSFS